MSRVLFKNLRIVNPTGDPVYIANGCISCDGGVIDHVGSTPSNQEKYDKILDMKGKTALPGMINAHNHLYSSQALGMPPPRRIPKSFIEKLRNVWWKLDLALDEASTLASFQVGLLDCLRAGVTTIFDHHSSQNFIGGSTGRLIDVANRFGLRITTAFEITDRNGPQRFEAGLQENINSIVKYSEDPNVRPLVGLHASFTLSDTSLQIIRDHLKEVSDWGIHIHLAEDKADHTDAVHKGYKSVVDRLNYFGLLNHNSLVVHGIYVPESDINLLKKMKASLIHCPTSNANNRVGMLSNESIKKMDSGLGTDGMQSNMLTEAKEGQLIRSSMLTGGERNTDYLNLLFKNNPAIASKLFNQKIGKLEKDYQADFVFFDYHPRTKLNEYNVASHMLFGLKRPSDVITRGKFRVRDNKFVDINEDEIFANARLESVKLWEKIQQIG